MQVRRGSLNPQGDCIIISVMSLLLTLQNVAKAYIGRPVLTQVDAVIAPGWRIGVIGRNGSGKSTLARIITGAETADSGAVQRDPTLRLAHLEQYAAFAPNESLLGYLERATGRKNWECAKMAARFGFANAEFGQPAETLSGGRTVRLRLAAALLGEPNLLVLDEPTNYLDLPTQMLLEAYLKTYRGALLIVSHDREFLNRNCDRTWEVERGRVYVWNGTVDEYRHEKESRATTAERHNINVETKKRQLERFVERFRAKASKATQAKSKMKQLARLEKEFRDLPPALPKTRIRLPDVTGRRGEALHTYRLDVGYGDRIVARDANLSLPRGSRTAILGENGAGKSTLLKTVAGALEPLGGSYRWYSGALIGYLPQLPQAETSEESVLTFLRRQANPKLKTDQVMRAAGNFLFPKADWDKPLRVLSVGERSRLHLAALTLGDYDILVLDEPTTHLDAETSDALADALAEYRGSVVFVSHDRAFTARAATELVLVEDGLIKKYPGTYDEYVTGLAAKAAEANPLPAHPETATDGMVKNDTRALRRKLTKIDEKLAALRREHGEIIRHFTDHPTDPDPEPRKRLAAVDALIAATEEEWLALAEELQGGNA